MLKSWLVLVLLLASAVSRPLDSSLDASWENWKHTYSKEYKSPAEEAFRRGIWEKTLRYIERHNREYEQGLHTYELGMNQFGDRVKFVEVAVSPGSHDSDSDPMNTYSPV